MGRTVWKGISGNQRACESSAPKKETRNGRLTKDEELVNRNISTDKVIVESFFWKTVWTIEGLSEKYRWSENIYDDKLFYCFAITTALDLWHSLREED